MKRHISLLILLAGISLAAFSQNTETTEPNAAKVEKRMKEVQDYKMKFLAQEMELSEVQKKKFFEVYEDMQARKHECYKEAMKMDREIKHNHEATEADYQQVTLAFNKANAEWAEYEKQYNEKFSEFLSQKQIYKMREAENTFRMKFEEMKHNRKRDHSKR